MTDFIDRYEVELRLAARRHGGAARRLRGRRAGLALGVTALLAAPALAVTQDWMPELGSTPQSRPTATTTGPPAEQLALLAVLRREQTAADRGPATLAALRELTPGVRGVRTAGVRALGGVPPATLVPVAQFDAGTAGSAGLTDDGLCLVVPDGADGAGFTCTTTDRLQAGRAVLAVGDRVVLLVPDGVARVAVTYAEGGPTEPVTVRENAAAFMAPADRPGTPVAFAQTWLDAGGRVVRTVASPGGPLPAAGTRPAPGAVVCGAGAPAETCRALQDGSIAVP